MYNDLTGQIVHNGDMTLYVIFSTEEYSLLQNLKTHGFVVAYRMRSESDSAYNVYWAQGHYFVNNTIEDLLAAYEYFAEKVK